MPPRVFSSPPPRARAAAPSPEDQSLPVLLTGNWGAGGLGGRPAAWSRPRGLGGPQPWSRPLAALLEDTLALDSHLHRVGTRTASGLQGG